MRALKALGGIVLIVFMGYGSMSLVNDVSSNEDDIYANCRTDRKFRKQYLKRAVVERRLLHLEAQSNRYIAQILMISLEKPPPPGDHTTPAQREFVQRATDTFARTSNTELELSNLIHILPLRKCS